MVGCVTGLAGVLSIPGWLLRDRPPSVGPAPTPFEQSRGRRLWPGSGRRRERGEAETRGGAEGCHPRVPLAARVARTPARAVLGAGAAQSVPGRAKEPSRRPSYAARCDPSRARCALLIASTPGSADPVRGNDSLSPERLAAHAAWAQPLSTPGMRSECHQQREGFFVAPLLRDFGRRRTRDRATRSAATRCQPAIPPIQGLGRERAEFNTRLSPLAASFFAWHRAARALEYCQ